MRLKWRKYNGRFSRPPSLEATGVVRVCGGCGQILVSALDYSSGFPKRTFPDCPNCLTAEIWCADDGQSFVVREDDDWYAYLDDGSNRRHGPFGSAQQAIAYAS